MASCGRLWLYFVVVILALALSDFAFLVGRNEAAIVRKWPGNDTGMDE